MNAASPDAPQAAPNDDAEIRRLAALHPLAYEREREKAAERLGVRVSLLDRLVAAQRAVGDDEGDQSSAHALPSPEPWPEAVQGDALLSDLTAAFRKHVVTEESAPEALALWTLHAHSLDAFAISPRLAITSAEKRCGKTTLLDVLGRLVPRPLPTANATAAAIFRTIEKLSPTLLIDEADTFLRRNDELRGVLNSGHRRATGFVLRLNGDDYEPCKFCTWAATAIAMIGRLPDTLTDRSIEIRLRRRLPDEPIARFRADRAGDLEVLARKAARWAADHLEPLRSAEPMVPQGLGDRAADNWTPLLAIADAAGGEWPERARQVLSRMALQADDADSASVREMLLTDIRAAFAEVDAGAFIPSLPTGERFTETDRLRSSDLSRYLVGLEGHPWAEWGAKRQSITPNALARLLKPFRIAPATLRFGRKTKNGAVSSKPDKGYMRSQFADAFARYLPPLAPSDQTVTPSQSPENGG